MPRAILEVTQKISGRQRGSKLKRRFDLSTFKAGNMAEVEAWAMQSGVPLLRGHQPRSDPCPERGAAPESA